MQKSFWWWQCIDRYIISLSPHLHTPFSPSLISLMVSVDVKHHVYCCVVKHVRELHVFVWTGIEFQMDAPWKEKLVLNRSVLGLCKIIVRDEERLSEQTKRDVRFWGARVLHVLNTSTASLNIRFSLRGSKLKRCILASVVVNGLGSISFAARLSRELSVLFLLIWSLQPPETVEA